MIVQRGSISKHPCAQSFPTVFWPRFQRFRMRRIYAAVVLFCLYCLFSVGHFCTMLPEPVEKTYSPYIEWYSRCKGDPNLPPRGAIGYIDGFPAEKLPATPMAFFYLGRYALAPLCLEHNAGHDWVLVNTFACTFEKGGVP